MKNTILTSNREYFFVPF